MKRKDKKMNQSLSTWVALFLLIGLSPVSSEAQTFDSKSTGADGALDFTWAAALPVAERTIIFDPSNPNTFDLASPNRRLDIDNDNIFHFTTVLIPAKVTVVLTATKLNWAPVYWLATGDVVIESLGILSLTGAPGHAASSQGEARFPSIPGPGGFPGGIGASALNFSQPGFGPGAGQPPICDCDSASGSHTFQGTANSGVAGPTYGSPFLLPLVGGSGGAGAGDSDTAQTITRSGGGAGGGAIVIASSTKIVNNGIIIAKGGSGTATSGCCTVGGGAGSGGAVRLMAPIITGTPYASCCPARGYISVFGGITGNSGQTGGHGRIRIEAFNHQYQGRLFPDNVTSVRIGGLVPTTPFLPTDPKVPKWPSIHVTSINGIAVSQEPSASFAVPDATVPTRGVVSVVFTTKNIPTSAVVTIHLVSPDSNVIKVTPDFMSGTEATGTWQASVSFPLGFSRGFLQATWSPPPPPLIP